MTFPAATYQPEMVSVDKDGLLDLIEICEENTQELLDLHLCHHGETTAKNKTIANLYRRTLAKCEQLKKTITP